MPATTTTVRREAARHMTGRFGEQEHSDPELTLAIDDIEAAQARRAAAADDRREVKEMLREVKGASNRYAYKWHVLGHQDDIVGDTVVQIIAQRERGTANFEVALTTHIARQTAMRYIDPGSHHVDGTARRRLREWFDAFIQNNGRMPTERERAAHAERIRLAEPAGRRPSVGFENRQEYLSLDEPDENSGGTIGDSIPALASNGYATATSMAAAANDTLEDETSTFKPADARKNIWNLLSEDGPKVAVKCIHDDREHRTAVEEAGGAAAVARAWAAGETAEDDPANIALFAPFGNLSERERGEASDVLTRNAAYADKIWDSAMTAALDIQKLRAIKRRESRHAQALAA